jgi:hypothetical protein
MNKTTRCRVSYEAGNLFLSRGIISLLIEAVLHVVSKEICCSDLEPWPEYQDWVLLISLELKFTTNLSFSILSDDRSNASSKTVPPHSAI